MIIFVVPVFFTLLISLISFCIRCRRKRMRLFEKYGIPGPKPNLIFGNLMEYKKKREKCIAEWIGKYGNLFGFYLGGKPFMICSDPELLKLIQIKEFKIFANRDMIISEGGIGCKLINNAFVLRKDDDWKSSRSILSNSFSSGKIKTISTLMPEAIELFLKKIEKQNEKPFEICEFYKKLTFDVICRSALGFKTNVQNEETSKFVQSVYKILEPDISDILIVMSVLFPEMEPIPTYVRRIVDSLKNSMNYPCVRVVFDTCRKIVFSRKQSGYYAPDLLQTMIDAEDESGDETKKFSTDSIIANAVAFIAAGYHTTSGILGWCTYHLSENPTVQEKVREEINENIDKNKDIEYSDLSSLRYLDQVISETLRFHPLTTMLAV